MTRKAHVGEGWMDDGPNDDGNDYLADAEVFRNYVARFYRAHV